jgi:uncharacterized protein YjbI with pentapeptide repeats
MANQEHLAILKQSVETWNRWRQEHLNVRPDLSGIDLTAANLGAAHLNGADLSGANLGAAYLNGADLSGANLSKADLSEANLIRANLEGAYLVAAYLGAANFNHTNLNLANFSQTCMFLTIFGNVDFRLVRGLESVKHNGPSTIGIDTISRSQGNIPESFLRGAGVPNSFITYARSLVGQPINYYSCFISYSSKDHDFAERLYADLQSKGIRCWFAPEDLKIGAKIRPSIDESIYISDKLLLVLSQHSIASWWVEQEVETALAKEHKENRVVLFPIRLDKTVMDTEGSWPALISNTRHIGDFTGWKEHDAYQKALGRLLRDLKAEV